MEDVFVRPEHRGHGYGTRLVEHVKDFARRKDFKRITLLTDRVSEESQRFFHRNGFVLSSMVPMRLLLGDEGEKS
jgi:GNAT superfamily N-acetyltransferase